jgi:hypothetical protein
MKYCDKCKIEINTLEDYCPLCHQSLQGEATKKTKEKYPEYVSINRKIYPITKKILLFATITSIVILLMINLIDYSGQLWAIIPIGGIIFFWLLVSIGVFSKNNIAQKLVFLTSLLIGLLVLIDQMTLKAGWSHNYLLPFLLLACNLAISVIILIKRMDYRDYILYLLTIVFLSIVPIVLVIFKVITIKWPAIIAFGLALFILLFIIFFFPKSIKDEIKKRFHA